MFSENKWLYIVSYLLLSVLLVVGIATYNT